MNYDEKCDFVMRRDQLKAQNEFYRKCSLLLFAAVWVMKNTEPELAFIYDHGDNLCVNDVEENKRDKR